MRERCKSGNVTSTALTLKGWALCADSSSSSGTAVKMRVASASGRPRASRLGHGISAQGVSSGVGGLSSAGVSDIYRRVTLRSSNMNSTRNGGTLLNSTVFVTRKSERPSITRAHLSGVRAILQTTAKRTSSNRLTDTRKSLICAVNWWLSTTSRGILESSSLPPILCHHLQGPSSVTRRNPLVGEEYCLVGDHLAWGGALPSRKVVSEVAKLRRVITPECLYHPMH